MVNILSLLHVDVDGTHISNTVDFDQFTKHFSKKQEGIHTDALTFYRWKPLVSMLFFLPDRTREYSF